MISKVKSLVIALTLLAAFLFVSLGFAASGTQSIVKTDQAQVLMNDPDDKDDDDKDDDEDDDKDDHK